MVKQQVSFVITSKGLHWYSKESVSCWTAINRGADTNGDFLMPYIWRGRLKPLFITVFFVWILGGRWMQGLLVPSTHIRNNILLLWLSSSFSFFENYIFFPMFVFSIAMLSFLLFSQEASEGILYFPGCYQRSFHKLKKFLIQQYTWNSLSLMLSKA